jgi:sulfite reductase (NADPH) hemoprotein beta-component
MDMERPLSPNEHIKRNSNFLRGTIADGLTQVETGSLADDDTQLTKFHGIYQQDDRDLRAERGKQRMEKAFSFMARMRVPAGILSPAQWLAAEKVAVQRGNGTLRLTTRQTIQFHGIIKSNLRPAIQELNTELLDTIAACGDVNRNVVASVDPWRRAGHQAVTKLATDIATHLLPHSRAWHEIWIGEERVAGGVEEDEPIYGRTYMPRKFKIAVALPPHNDVDVFAQDLSFIAIEQDGAIIGYNVAVGGGMGMTHGEPDTYPRAGDTVGFCLPQHAVDVAEKVVTVQRDFGDRSDRKHARLKYTIDRMGLDVFVAEVNARLASQLQPARDVAFTATGDRLGWADSDDGKSHFTLYVESGRVVDLPGRKLLSGLHAVAELDAGRFIITANQNLVLADIPAVKRDSVAALVKEYGLDQKVGGLRLNAIACVALPTCGLALAESERYLPHLVTRLEDALEKVGLRDKEITIRMTGCPNGCARPYMSEIGLVGRTPGLYNLYLGAAHEGTRLSKLYKRDVGDDAIVAALTPLFASYATERLDGEHFGDFVIRIAAVAQTRAGLDFHENLSPELRS